MAATGSNSFPVAVTLAQDTVASVIGCATRGHLLRPGASPCRRTATAGVRTIAYLLSEHERQQEACFWVLVEAFAADGNCLWATGRRKAD